MLARSLDVICIVPKTSRTLCNTTHKALLHKQFFSAICSTSDDDSSARQGACRIQVSRGQVIPLMAVRIVRRNPAVKMRRTCRMRISPLDG